MMYFYMQRDSLCFLTLTEESYPKRLAFLYLEEVADAILQEFVQEYGNDVRGLFCITAAVYYAMVSGKLTFVLYDFVCANAIFISPLCTRIHNFLSPCLVNLLVN